MSSKNDFRYQTATLLNNRIFLTLGIPLFAILLSLIVGAIIIAFLGKDPLIAYKSLLQGVGLIAKPNYGGNQGRLSDFLSFLNALTPMIFAALAVAVALKAGLFNIGVAGQMLTAGFLATVLIGYSDLAPAIAKPLVIIVGILAGAALAGLVGFLKYKFNINEVVSTIMLNYIAQYIIAFFIYTYFVDPISRQSKVINDAARLTLVNVVVGSIKIDIPLAMVLALAAAFALRFLFDRTTPGFELRMVGTNPRAAKYAGVKVGKNMVMAMVISGALAGLAGVSYYLGYFGSIQPKVLPSTGFDSIAVALLGNINPIGIIFASFLVTILSKGSTYLSSVTGIKSEIPDLITGLILLFSACGVFLRQMIRQLSLHLLDGYDEDSAEAKSKAAPTEGGKS